MNNKSYCEIHHFYYVGNRCPLCQKEKYDKIYKSYDIKEVKEKEITEKDLKRLSDKFKVIRK